MARGPKYLFLLIAACQHSPSLARSHGTVTILQVTPSSEGATVSWKTTLAGNFLAQIGSVAIVARSPVAAGATTTTIIPSSALVPGQNQGSIIVIPVAGTPAVGTFQITVTSNGTSNTQSAVLTFSPTTFDFPTTTVGEKATQTFTVTNGGNGAASFAAPTSAGLGLAAPYSASDGTCLGATTLAASASCTLIVTFAPSVSGASNATLSFAYNDGAQDQSITVPLTGTSTSPCDAIGTNSNFAAVGSGIPSDPYILCNAGQLVGMSYSTGAWHKSFRLASDIDLSGNGPTDATPFHAIGTDGNGSTPFTGTFDGAGHTVSNLSIVSPNSTQGFFGHVFGGVADIRNLTLTRVQVVANGTNVGALAGELEGGRVFNCHVDGSVTGGQSVGGLVGALYVGAMISTSSAAVNVQGTTTVNAVIGGSGNNHGGLIGLLSGDGGSVFNAYATGNVVGASWIGGLVGSVASGLMQYCYASGSVTSSGGTEVGGFVGYSNNLIANNCFAVGKVLGNDPDTGGSGYDEVGAWTGDNDNSSYNNSFYFSDPSNCSNTGGVCNSLCVCPASAACTKTANNTYCSDAFPDALLSDFYDPAGSVLGKWGSDFSKYWMAMPGALPVLQPTVTFFDETAWGDCTTHQTDTPFAGGDGSFEAPFLICTADQLGALSSNSSLWPRGLAFKLMDNIDLSKASVPFTPIGNTQNNGASVFLGVFDGNGKTITHLILDDSTATDTNEAGFFAAIHGSIFRLGIVGASLVTSTPQCTAIMAGSLSGSITDSYTTGTVINHNANNSGYNDPAAAGIACYANLIFHSYTSASVTTIDSTNSGMACGLTAYGTGIVGCFAQVTIQSENYGSEITNCDPGDGSYLDSFYDSSSTCDNCSDHSSPANCLASKTVCACPGRGTSTSQGFNTATNPPMATSDNYGWDFVNIWQSDSESLPTLR